MFQSAPRSRDRGDVGGLRSNVPDIRFNPRPGHATGATHCSCGTVTKVSVSIRAPVTRPGRLSDPLLTYQDCAFQSAPRSRDRGDSAPRPQQTRTEPFQSAPRSRDRGDPVWLMINAVSRSFNPRPGHATGATGCHGVARFRHVCFNPRPGHATGATCQSATRVTPQAGFNPRPGHATGATLAMGRKPTVPMVSIRAPVTRPGRPDIESAKRRVQLVSIRAPVTRPGRLGADDVDGVCPVVSIRAPVTRPGRHWTAGEREAAEQFQSAPRSRDRGDTRDWWAARQNEGFQSAPRSRDRGDPRHFAAFAERNCFNPRPGHATGATRLPEVEKLCARVSIRAPVTRPGRPGNSREPRTDTMFQSAPRSRDRGDKPPPFGMMMPLVFQSAPRSRDRGDFAQATERLRPELFQSAPRSRDRGDLLLFVLFVPSGPVSIRAPVTRPGRPSVPSVE